MWLDHSDPDIPPSPMIKGRTPSADTKRWMDYKKKEKKGLVEDFYPRYSLSWDRLKQRLENLFPDLKVSERYVSASPTAPLPLHTHLLGRHLGRLHTCEHLRSMQRSKSNSRLLTRLATIEHQKRPVFFPHTAEID